MTTVLVTGASGFIGAHLVNRLVRDGFDVAGIHTSAENLYRLSAVKDKVRLHQIDLRNSAEVSAIFHRYSLKWVFHLAAFGVRAELDGVEDMVQVNTLATATLASVALRHNINRFIYVGSGFEYQPQATPIDESAPLKPVNFYGASKAAAWLLLDYLHRMETLALVVFRPFSVYGPGEHESRLVPYVITHALQREPMQLTHGFQIRDYVFVEDVVEVLLKGATHPSPVGETYNIGAGPQGASTVRAIAEAILRLTEAPQDLCKYGAAKRARSEPPYFVADPSKVQVQLGWRPCVSLEEGLARTIEWYKDHVLFR